MTKMPETLHDLERASGLAGMAAVGQMVGMQALLAEMQALSVAMPGLLQTDGLDRRSTEEQLQVEAEVEAGFDNMPV